ncbi:MAG TPA: hypothetical protein VGB83_06715 [Actinomycetota bacterium]
MRVLNIDVPDSLATRWRQWLAPDVQPFFVPRSHPHLRSLPAQELTPELRDTFRTYALPRALRTLFLDEPAFLDLPRDARAALVRAQVVQGRGAVPTVRGWCDLIDASLLRAQADGHRFVWWASLVDQAGDAVFERLIGRGLRPSRHRAVSVSAWRKSASRAPRAQTLAGTFARGSGPNCFGAVMGACGESGAENDWVQQAQFESWLAGHARPGGRDVRPGTILVWRDGGGVARHAALTLAGGWGFEKPSQEWSTPFMVLPLTEIVRANRSRGIRLERWRPAAG